MPLHRRLSNKITSSIISYVCEKRVHDSQCGYRRYKIDDILCGSYLEDGFQFESEVLINLLGKNCTIHHIDIPTIYNQENSSMNNISDTFRFIRLIIRYLT